MAFLFGDDEGLDWCAASRPLTEDERRRLEAAVKEMGRNFARRADEMLTEILRGKATP